MEGYICGRRAGRIVVIAGVSGSGKSTVGALLAKSMGCTFLDADDFHSQENKDKMKRGIPLTDSDRSPWLESLCKKLMDCAQHDKTIVLACSALKPSYRQILRTACHEGMHDTQPSLDGERLNSKLTFLLLQGPQELFALRLAKRFQEGSHFMPPSLLSSQLNDMKIDDNEGDIFPLDASLSPASIVDHAKQIINQQA